MEHARAAQLPETEVKERIATALSVAFASKWPRRGQYVVLGNPLRLAVIADDPLFDPEGDAGLDIPLTHGAKWRKGQLLRGGDRDTEFGAQVLFLQRLGQEGEISGNMIDTESFMNEKVRTADLHQWAWPFAERWRWQQLDFLMTIPSRGQPICQEVASQLNRTDLFIPRKAPTVPEVLANAPLFVEQLYSHANQRAEQIFAKQDALEPYRGKNAAYIDDIIFTGRSAIAGANVLRRSGCNLIAIGAVLDKGVGGAEAIAAHTAMTPYVLLKIARGGVQRTDGTALVHFEKPPVYLRMRVRDSTG
jgi:adenine/guanine phosphoribosyltransferase-like PRPP-binding protein